VNITHAAIEKNRVTAALLLVVLVAGLTAYSNMPRNEDPGFVIRTALVTTHFPGASPERVEQLVTDKLEKVIQEIPELDFIQSESRTGISLVFVNFREEFRQMRPLFDDLRRKVEKAEDDLPADVIGPIVNDEFGDVFGIILAITGGEDFSYKELRDIADEVRDELLLIDEVAKVEIHGAQEERIFVEYNNARLAELGLSPVQLQQILQSRNIVIAGGEIRTEYEEFALEPSGNFATFDEVRQAVIRVPGTDQVVYLQDVAEIRRGYVDPPSTKMRATGEPALALAISMREGGRIDRLGDAVSATVDRLRQFYPIGIEFDFITFQPEVVAKKVADFQSNLIQAVLIVTLVMLAFLGPRTGLVVASLIPMAMVAAFLVMSFFDIWIDQMSIAALIMALGMLVDNAIVMSESIMVQMAAGKKAVQAAIDSAAELRIPLLTSSATTAAAFLPIYLAESAVGEYTAPLFTVVTITLLCSWLLALTMVPMLCVTALKVKRTDEEQAYTTRFYRAYRRLLLFGLRRRWLSLAAVLVVFAVAMQGFGLIPAIFFPVNDRPLFTLEVDLPQGTPLARTEAVVQRIEQHLLDHDLVGPEREEGVTSWGVFIGQGAPRFTLTYAPEQQSPNYAYFLLNASSRAAAAETIPRLEAFCRESFPEIVATVRPMEYGPPAWPPIQIRLSGRDSDRLFGIVDAVQARLAETAGARPLGDDWGARSKKLFVDVDQPRARRAGVTNQDVAISLQTYLSGLQATEFRENDDLIPVLLRSVASERENIDKLETLNVYAQATGQSVPLKQVADIDVVWQPSVIHRRDRLRTVTINAAFDPGFNAIAITAGLRPWLEEQKAGWGPGYDYELGGVDEESGDANASIGEKLPIAGLIIVLLLVAQFNSIRRPLIILFTIPLSLIGVVGGLLFVRLLPESWAAGAYFGFMTFLGVISLAGIVINNAIVLIDRIRIEIEEREHPPARAILEAAQRRLRPILLTTCTTIGGLVPLWLGGGPMWEPMAIAIIFGLGFATMLTLGIVPILYSLLFRVPAADFDDVERQMAGADA
jgi:multidrug efflux pump subunit AcrB